MAIQGFTYWGGPEGDRLRAKPASAFSKGDLLMLDSLSSVSRVNITLASGVDIVGVAESDSNQSIEGLVTYRVPDADTLWLASFDTATSATTPGVELDIAFGAPNGRQYVTNASANSVRAVVVRGTAGSMAMDQSINSQVVVKLIRHAGNFELS